ncbi:MAG: YbbR-like domain-containing protein [Blautia sp.]|jgi:YbbR domain-containing protein
MKEKFLNNIPLKIMSVAVAILVWLLVVNIDNPIRTRIITDVPVQVLNEAYIESGGKMCLIEESQDDITVSVTGKRKTVENLTASDVIATADLKQMLSLDTNPVMVPINVSVPGISQVDIQPVPRNMAITIEEMMSQDFIVTVDTGASKPEVGYEIGEVQANPEKVQITGPQTLIKKIDRVVAYTDVTGITGDLSTRVKLKIFDKNQDELSANQVKYLKFDISEPTVDVAVSLWKVRDNVTIEAGYVGEPAIGYKVEALVSTPSKVKVAGTDEALSQLAADGNKIVIPAENIDVFGKSADFETKVNIAKLLPDGIKLTTGTSDSVIVKASILPVGSKEYSIPTKRIVIQNIPEGLQAVCETEKVEIRVSEGTQSLEALDPENIQLSVDLSGKKAGSYEVPVQVSLPAGYAIVSNVTITVKLSEVATATNLTIEE